MSEIKVNLSIRGLEELKQKLLTLQSGLKQASNAIVEELTDVCEKEIAQNYNNSLYTDGNEDSKIFRAKTENGYKVGAKGSQVAYREFGTGTEGLNKPHPIKGKFGLKGYNTGKTIRQNKSNTSLQSTYTKKTIGIGQLYWSYKKDGRKIYTQGIPAGMEIYNASIITKMKKKAIIKKKVGEVISKL